jgi:predicted aminopeptidase
MRLLSAREPIERVLADPETPEALRAELARVSRVREYAAGLGLRVGNRYTQYAPWPGDRIVTTVVATRPGEVEPAGFWFPIVGRVPYKGYFDLARADAESARLRERGLDVCEVPVPAYSTLGWFDDPVTGPMLRQPEGDLVEMLLHELVHATVFSASDADWNEGVASFVGEEARVRFYADSAGDDAAAAQRLRVEQRRAVRRVLLDARSAARRVYAAHPPGALRDAARADVDRSAREAVAALPLAETDAKALAARIRTNDACLALAATYSALTPCLSARLEALDGDLAQLVAALAAANEADDPRSAAGCAQD